ncbi:HEAT repeat-containing protein [Thermanaeromonas toyohensis ToBE]|uniref:HEAT repeat-containing protein n=1 Tax=Thermanaeromonas toyohensis ToBE TaxID=698762 RepID=A0A1W1W341_9FIRM|nr:HEAT repeat domain-containing protein [Thermanaeromonas toyohensis]SMC00038.1 HEAT repeat-containing protein [Thermanaeromonas toyohensis ToBE]
MLGWWVKKDIDPERLKRELSQARRLSPKLKRLLRRLKPEKAAELILACWPSLCSSLQANLKVWFKEEGLVEEWLGLLKAGSSEARASVSELLGILGQSRALGLLLSALADRDEAVQMAAAAGLVYLRDPRCLEPLALALAEPQGKIPPARVAQVLVAFGEASIPYLASLLEKVPAEIVARILEILGSIGGPQVLPYLTWGLKNHKAAIRVAAARALGEAGLEEAGEELLRVLTDEDPKVRAAAAYTLGRLKYLRALPYLKRAVEDSSWQVRTSAKVALKALEGT